MLEEILAVLISLIGFFSILLFAVIGLLAMFGKKLFRGAKNKAKGKSMKKHFNSLPRR